MRRMRFAWPVYLLVFALVLGAVFFVERLTKDRSHSLDTTEAKTATKYQTPAQEVFGDDPSIEGHGSHPSKLAKLAKLARVKKETHSKNGLSSSGHHSAHDLKAHGGEGLGDESDAELDDSNLDELTAVHKVDPKGPLQAAFSKKEDSKGGVCSSIEYPGTGPSHANVSIEDWETVMTVFHEVKSDFLVWLEHRQKSFSHETYSVMQDQVRSLRIQRPPTPEEPDLAFRGISALSYDHLSQPLLRVGGGFLKLLAFHPARGKFELARVVAQIWAPCELQSHAGGQPWTRLIQCLGVQDPAACEKGSYSDAGWAVSSALAVQIANPGCTLPAFNEPVAAGCLHTALYQPDSGAPHVATVEHPANREPAHAEAVEKGAH